MSHATAVRSCECAALQIARSATHGQRPGALKLPRDVPTDAGCRVQGHDKRDTCTKATDTPIDSPLTTQPTLHSPRYAARFISHTTDKARAI